MLPKHFYFQRQFFQKNINLFSRNLYSHKKLNKTPIGSSFTAVYRLPDIFACSLVNKAKKYSLIASGIGIPLSLVCSTCELCTQDVSIVVTTVGVVACTGFLIAGTLVNRLIGFVYVSKDRSEVKFSYINFWGDRKDEIFSIKNIVPIEEIFENSIFSQFLKYIPSKVYVSTLDKPFKIFLKHGKIISPRLCNHIFNTNFEEDEDFQTK